MKLDRREFVASLAAAGTITIMPFTPGLATGGDAFKTASDEIKVHPVSHASIVLETPAGTIFVDPVGDPAAYSSFPKPDLISITHHHGDHFKPETLSAIIGENTKLLTNPTVYDKLTADMKSKATSIANGESTEISGIQIDAIPAHNLTEGREKFHPKGRDNGYVMTLDGFRLYVSGDTEDVPEMRALKDIDLAFVCMNLPFTMTAEAAASAVAEFKPKVVYPYHYRGRDGGTQDPKKFAELVGAAAEVKLADWY